MLQEPWSTSAQYRPTGWSQFVLMVGNGFSAPIRVPELLRSCCRALNLPCQRACAPTAGALQCLNRLPREHIGSFLSVVRSRTRGLQRIKRSSRTAEMNFEETALSVPHDTRAGRKSRSPLNSLPEKDPSLRDLLRIFHRRTRAIIVTTAVVFLLAVFACVFMTRRYTATSIIQLQKSSSDSLGLDSLMGAESGAASDDMSVNVDLQTQADILQSESLALKVIKDLNLAQNEDFKPHFSPVGWVMGLVSPRGPADPPHASLEDSPGRRLRVVRVFGNNLKVKVTAGTRLLEVDYTNRDPKVAAAVVNHLVQSLIDYTFQTKFTATNQVSQWLEGQLGDLRKQSEQLQSRVVALQQGSGIFGVGGTDPQGKPVIYSPVLDRLQQSTAQLSQAQMNRVLKGSVAEVVKTGNAKLISQLRGTSIGSSSSPGVTNSLAVIQNLRLQEATLRAQIDQDASQFEI